MSGGRSFTEDAIILVVLLAILCVPILALQTSVSTSLVQAARACVRALGLIATLVIVLVVVGGLLLLGEQLHARWTAQPDTSTDDVAMRTPFGRIKTLSAKHDKRKRKEHQFQDRVEHVVKSAEKRWDAVGSSSGTSRRRTGAADDIELRDMASSSQTSAVKRRPPPPPPPL